MGRWWMRFDRSRRVKTRFENLGMKRNVATIDPLFLIWSLWDSIFPSDSLDLNFLFGRLHRPLPSANLVPMLMHDSKSRSVVIIELIWLSSSSLSGALTRYVSCEGGAHLAEFNLLPSAASCSWTLWRSWKIWWIYNSRKAKWNSPVWND